MYDIYAELDQINKKYGLVGFNQKDGFIFYGEIKLNHEYNNLVLKNKLYISMFVPFSFPNDLPIVKDIGKQIEKEFHKNDEEELCLACNLEMFLYLKQPKNTSICNFIEMFLIPFLFSYTCYKETQNVPYGERSHGVTGILESYKEHFNINNDTQMLDLLKYISTQNYRGHDLCPCGSRVKIRECHGSIVIELLTIVGKENALIDWEKINKCKQLIQLNKIKEIKRKKRRDYYFGFKKKFPENYIPRFYRRYIK